MSNVIKFPNKDPHFQVYLESIEQDYMKFEERIAALAEVLDLNIQGMYHTIDVDAEEIMMALIQLAATWSVRAEMDADEFMTMMQGIHLEVTTNAEET